MTVPSEKTKVNHVADGIEVDFPYDFLVLDVAHMEVYLDDVITFTGYTVSGIGNVAGGTVTFAVPPADQVVVTLRRYVPYTQLIDYVPYDKFPAETHESGLDLAAMGRQQLQELLDRVMLLPVSWTGGPLPFPAPNPLKFLQTDASNNILWGDPPAGGGGSATFTGLLDTPADYTGAALQLVRVNAAATALEFSSAGTGVYTGGQGIDIDGSNVITVDIGTAVSSSLGFVGIPPGGTLQVLRQKSIQAGAGGDPNGLELVGDVINPQAGQVYGFNGSFKGWYDVTSLGAGTLSTITDLTTFVNNATTLEFVGTNDANVVVSDIGGGSARVSIDVQVGGGGGGHIIQNDGSPLPQQPALNFLPGLTAVDNAGNTSSDVSLDIASLPSLPGPLTLTDELAANIGGTGRVSVSASGLMLQSTYDSTGDGVVNSAESLGFIGTNLTGLTLNPGDLVQFDSAGNIVTRASASTQEWAYAIVSENTILAGAQGLVVLNALVVNVDTSGFAVGDLIYTDENGAFTATPTPSPGTEQIQQVGVVLSVNATTGVLYCDIGQPEEIIPDRAAGVIYNNDGDAFVYSNPSLTVWTEVVPTLAPTVSGDFVVQGTNNGRIRIDFTGATQPPGAGAIDGVLIIHMSTTLPASNDLLDVTAALNGAVIIPDIHAVIQAGSGGQGAGVTIPITLSFPISNVSDLDEFSIVARGTVTSFAVETWSIQFQQQSGGSGGAGGGTTIHNDLTGRSATGAHPATAVSNDDTGGVLGLNVQAGLDFLYGDKFSTFSNQGGGVEVGLQKTGVDLELRTLTSLDSSVIFNQTATTIDLSAAAGGNVTSSGTTLNSIQVGSSDANGIQNSVVLTNGSMLGFEAGAYAVIAAGTPGLPLLATGPTTAPAFGQVDTAGYTDASVTNAKLFTMAAETVKLRQTTPGAPQDVRVDALPTGTPASGDAIFAQKQSGVLVRFDPDDLGGVPVSRTVTGGDGIQGGGDLSADRVFDIRLSGVNSGLELTGTPGSQSLQTLRQMSIVADSGGLRLDGDSAVPGPNRVYGTDGGGFKTWKPDPAGGTGSYVDAQGNGTPIASGDTTLNFADGTGTTANVSTAAGVTTVSFDATGGGSGDVVGPASAVADNLAAFDGTTGKLIKDAGIGLGSVVTSGLDTIAGEIQTGVTGANKDIQNSGVLITDVGRLSVDNNYQALQEFTAPESLAGTTITLDALTRNYAETNEASPLTLNVGSPTNPFSCQIVVRQNVAVSLGTGTWLGGAIAGDDPAIAGKVLGITYYGAIGAKAIWLG